MRSFLHNKPSSLNFELESQTVNEERIYTTPEGNKYPSVTTVLSSYNSKAIYEWRKSVGEEEANKISKLASSRGTKLHSLCEKYLLNEMTPLEMNMVMPDIKSMFNMVRPHIDKNVGTVYCIEQSLYSNKLKLAGRTDCVAQWKDSVAVLDWKTSRKIKDEDMILNYFMQCTAYSIMFEELTGINAENVVILMASTEGEVKVFEKNRSAYIPLLFSYIDKYWEKA